MIIRMRLRAGAAIPGRLSTHPLCPRSPGTGPSEQSTTQQQRRTRLPPAAPTTKSPAQDGISIESHPRSSTEPPKALVKHGGEPVCNVGNPAPAKRRSAVGSQRARRSTSDRPTAGRGLRATGCCTSERMSARPVDRSCQPHWCDERDHRRKSRVPATASDTSAIVTVPPAKNTAPPEVAVARASDSCSSRPSRNPRKCRVTMNSA